jgi:DNA mismatch repair protein MutL
MSRIRVLSEALANRIAAGEVVERPASVVKELVENAIDAGAGRIEVDLEDGGKSLVVVRDDGCGMDRDDALLSFQQHATSKLAADADLATIETRGFRGEALSAIASCASVTLVTAETDGEGTRVRIDNGVLRDVATVGAPRGTSVEVRDLFGQLPARRKFLRSASTELARVHRYLEQQALAMPDLHFILRQGRILLEAPRAKDLTARVSRIMGPEFIGAAVVVDARAGGLSVRAWLVRSDFGVGRLTQISTIVNGRPVSDRMLGHALREAGRMLFGADVAPAGILLVDLPALDVDINVHPAKREIRFARPGEVHDTVRDLIRGAVQASGSYAPALDVDQARRIAVSTAAQPHLAENPPWIEGPRSGAAGTQAGGSVQEDIGPRRSVDEAARWAPSSATPSPAGSGRRILGQHRNTYVIVEDEQGLVLVDQHCAHERVIFDRVMASMGSSVARQMLLEPVIVEVPRSLAPVLANRLEDLARLGLEVEPFGEASFAVRAVPASVGTMSPAELLRELASQDLPGTEPLERVRHLAATIACKAAVKAGHSLGHERMKWIVDELFRADVPTTCPHGRVAILRLSDRDIDHRFGRI